MIAEQQTPAPVGARIAVSLATFVVLMPWLGFCLLLFGFSAMCTDDFDDSDCAEAMGTPVVLGVLGLLLCVLQVVVAVRGRTTKSVLLRGIPALVLAPLGVLLVVSLYVG
ncbi:hypothetical protein OU415_32770 [Saccharopolyspora sp. WRP15-2]|uniref:Transmembrane protein n=1 Tax=Saccharopolyspora oryzae TaxID=2997343 RepID=A0ABT4VA07_9PSEU|nr:hypothetical protein [Saccharopolyspora oryzae]MDA3630241.1 hypothetical protein [Saccharopolyspora oryzae]